MYLNVSSVFLPGTVLPTLVYVSYTMTPHISPRKHHLSFLTNAVYIDYNIMDKMDELTSVRDEQTMTQYVYGSTGMVSFDDERAICDKTEYAQVHDLNGYIIWEISGDLMPDLSTPLLDAANAKLLNPDLDCASLDLSAYVKEVISEAHPDSPGSAAAAAAGTGQASLTVYYPVYDVALCFNDGLEPDWMKADEMFGTLEVSLHFVQCFLHIV